MDAPEYTKKKRELTLLINEIDRQLLSVVNTNKKKLLMKQKKLWKQEFEMLENHRYKIYL